jgi:hypothetical protein
MAQEDANIKTVARDGSEALFMDADILVQKPLFSEWLQGVELSINNPQCELTTLNPERKTKLGWRPNLNDAVSLPPMHAAWVNLRRWHLAWIHGAVL